MSSPVPFSAADFLVEIDRMTSASFSRVVLPRQELRTVQYRNGGDGRSTTFAPAGIETPDHFTLTRGVTTETELWDWWKEAQAGAAARSASVVLLDEIGQAQARWNLVECEPIAYWLSPLDATEGGVLTETLRMTTGGMDRAR